MTSKERVIRSFVSGAVDRPPIFYMGTDKVNAKLAGRLGLTDNADANAVGTALGADVVFARPRFVGPAGAPRGFPIGQVHAQIHGEGANHSGDGTAGALRGIDDPKAVGDSSCWPDPEHFDYELPAEIRHASRELAVVARGNGALFLAAMSLRGMSEFLVDMALNPPMSHAILSRVTDYYERRIDKLLEASGSSIDIVDIGDDVAGQNGMLFSVDMWREFIKPHLERLVAVAHRYHKRALFFGCGGFRPVVDDLIEIGFDAVGRLQTEARGNEFTALKRDFGDRVGLWGAVDAQHVLVEGSPTDVAKHVDFLVTAATPGGRVVLGPTHTFTADTPTENILAMYRTLRAVSQG